ncbi:MAG: PaaI family thioesterase [Armatimonadota bacterium]
MCFACGPANPIGLKLRFADEDGRYVARFTPRPEHQGYDDVTHGGILATMLDEAMAKLAYEMGEFAVTAELQIRYRKPALVGEELTVSGWVISERRRLIDAGAEVRNSRGELVAEAVGRLMRVEQL